MRVSPKQLRERVERLHKAGYDIAIHWAYGRPRCTNATESRDISPRLACGEMATWLDGYEAGVEAERARVRLEDAKAGN